MSGFFNNAHTAVTRRFKNILTDDRTHSIFELILGNDPASSVECGPSFATRNAAAALAEEAQALPACDDVDSDGDADPLSLIPWPARPPPPPGGSAAAGSAGASQPQSPTSGGAAAQNANASTTSASSPPVSPQVISLMLSRDADLQEPCAGPASATRDLPTPPSSRISACGSALNELQGAPSPADMSQEVGDSTAQLASDFQGLTAGRGGGLFSSSQSAAAAPRPHDLLSLDEEDASSAGMGGGGGVQLHAPQHQQMPSIPGEDVPSAGTAVIVNAASTSQKPHEPLEPNGPTSHSVSVAVDDDDPFAMGVEAGAGITTLPGRGEAHTEGGAQGEGVRDALGRMSSSYIDVGRFDDSKGEFRQVKMPESGLVDPLGWAGEQQGSLL